MPYKIILFVEVLLLLIFLRIFLSIRGFNHLISISKNHKIKFTYNSNLKRNIKAIRLAAFIIPKCTCLLQSIAFKMLAPVNNDVSLVVGISKNKIFTSHAWIEINNKIIFGELPDQNQFKRILTVN